MAKNLVQFAKQLLAATSAKMRRACLDALLQEPDPTVPFAAPRVDVRRMMPKQPQIIVINHTGSQK